MQLDNYMRVMRLTDADLAELVGVDRSTVSRVRRGKTRPSWDLIRKIRTASEGLVTADDFLEEEK